MWLATHVYYDWVNSNVGFMPAEASEQTTTKKQATAATAVVVVAAVAVAIAMHLTY